MHQTTLIRRKVLTDRISKTKPNLGRFLRDIWKSWERQGKSCLAHSPEQKVLTQSKPSTRPSSQFKSLFLLTLLPKCAIQQLLFFIKGHSRQVWEGTRLNYDLIQPQSFKQRQSPYLQKQKGTEKLWSYPIAEKKGHQQQAQ